MVQGIQPIITVEYDHISAQDHPNHPYRGLYARQLVTGGGSAWPLLQATPDDIQSAATALGATYQEIDEAVDRFVRVASGGSDYVFRVEWVDGTSSVVTPESIPHLLNKIGFDVTTVRSGDFFTHTISLNADLCPRADEDDRP